MRLDLPTLLAMESFVAVCSGMVLLVAWSQNRKASALAIWGLADITLAGGIISLMLGSASDQPAWALFGGCLFALATGLMWKCARTLDARPAPLVLLCLGVAIVGLAGCVPGTRQIAITMALATGGVNLLASATTLLLAQKEQSAARWAFIVLITAHAMTLLIGMCSTLDGSTAQDGIPAIWSLFGFIHFESVIFSVGAAFFILAVVKERDLAAGRAAARIDPLTGIANRAAFFENAERVMQRCRREKATVSVIMFDLDRFKSINDTYGHAIGDIVIRNFCDVAAVALRPNDVFGRIGGEEFARYCRDRATRPISAPS